MRKIAIIPARGGSKRIPKKNIKLFCGKPIIAYSIELALKSNIFDEVIVSTDDEEIALISQNYNAKVPFLRPKSLSLDTTPTLPVIIHAIQNLKLQIDDLVCCIYPTAPLLEAIHIKLGLQKLLDCHKDTYVFSATEFETSPFRGFKIDQNEEISMLFPQYSLTRSQDLENIYYDAGAFYWGSAEVFCNQRNILDDGSIGIVLPRMCIQDINTLEDWDIAEIKYKIKCSK